MATNPAAGLVSHLKWTKGRSVNGSKFAYTRTAQIGNFQLWVVREWRTRPPAPTDVEGPAEQEEDLLISQSDYGRVLSQ